MLNVCHIVHMPQFSFVRKHCVFYNMEMDNYCVIAKPEAIMQKIFQGMATTTRKESLFSIKDKMNSLKRIMGARPLPPTPSSPIYPSKYIYQNKKP